MRPRLLLLIGLAVIVAACPLFAQDTDTPPYEIKLISTQLKAEKKGEKTERRVYVTFSVSPKVPAITRDYWVVIKEQDEEAKRVKITKEAKKARELSVVLAVDTSGSMTELTKTDVSRMVQAQRASKVFFEKLPAKVDAGLILFHHEVYKHLALTRDRNLLKAEIEAATPAGGTAYLDSCLKAIDMLKDVGDRDKALVILTDGVDLNSKVRDLGLVISKAKQAGVKIFPIGIGEPGKQQDVTSVLVLDISGSMNSPVDPDNPKDTISKLKSLIVSANRFVEIMPDSKHSLVRSTVLLFSDNIYYPGMSVPFEFTDKKSNLTKVINKLHTPEDQKNRVPPEGRIAARGETALFDATYDAIALLEAEDPPGKKVVVALTDGIDNTSRRRVEEVIDRAKKANVSLFMLGFGMTGEVDDVVMKKMAAATDGQYHLASNQKALEQIFEDLSVKIHDDGIDEDALQKLAKGTGGRYYPAKDVDQLQFILEEVTQSLSAETFHVDFPSLYQFEAGIGRPIKLELTDGVRVEDADRGGYGGRGLIMAQLSPLVYLGLLAALIGLLALPIGLKKLTAGAKG